MRLRRFYFFCNIGIVLIAVIFGVWSSNKNLNSYLKRNSVNIGLMGDVMLGEGVNEAIDRNGSKDLHQTVLSLK